MRRYALRYGGEVMQLPVTTDERQVRHRGETPRVAYVSLGRPAAGD